MLLRWVEFSVTFREIGGLMSSHGTSYILAPKGRSLPYLKAKVKCKNLKELGNLRTEWRLHSILLQWDPLDELEP